MWFADIYCDLQWVADQHGVLGERQMRLHGPRSTSLGIAIEFHFYGDGDRVRHVRALLDTEDQQAAETCADVNMQTWVAALESAVMLQTGHPFHVERLPGTTTFVTTFGQGGTESSAAVIGLKVHDPVPLDYRQLAYGFSVWNRELRHHLFYFRRLVDESLPLDVRWLNGYRLLQGLTIGRTRRAAFTHGMQWSEGSVCLSGW